VAPLALGIAVGRWGCIFAGLPDCTFGVATTLPWGVDFGDAIRRHPVQLYESFAMLGFLGVFLAGIAARAPLFLRQGFYLFVGW
jgi:phosphatidylglycerol---prolipoprotein diacylglyceryl transferase